MKVVGVKELKARLSEYLREVRRGEIVLVTDRDEVVAELRAVRRGAGVPDELHAALDALAEAGEVTRPRMSKQGWSWSAEGMGVPDGTAKRVLDELRAEHATSE
jgi:antitoxin (DNA-binding transcriptional repressor) of toxin-antitoxin stability system